MRVLIVEDNRRLAESIRDILKHWYDCDICGDGNTGCWLLKDGGYDAAVLDLMLPGMDGITLLREARKMGCQVPVLILTAKSELEDRVTGLESGADYYLTKPFDMQELLAVMKTILRRRGEMIPESLNLGNVTLNQADYTLRGPYKSIQLGKKEYDIMRILMVNRDMVVSKDTLLSKVWGNDAEAVENNVEIYISFLRKKLDFLKADVMIVTIRKLGYRIVDAAGADAVLHCSGGGGRCGVAEGRIWCLLGTGIPGADGCPGHERGGGHGNTGCIPSEVFKNQPAGRLYDRICRYHL